MSRILDAGAVAAMLGCSARTVEDHARTGVLPGTKFGEGWACRPFTSRASPARHRGAFGHHSRGPKPCLPTLDSLGCSQRIVH